MRPARITAHMWTSQRFISVLLLTSAETAELIWLCIQQQDWSSGRKPTHDCSVSYKFKHSAGQTHHSSRSALRTSVRPPFPAQPITHGQLCMTDFDGSVDIVALVQDTSGLTVDYDIVTMYNKFSVPSSHLCKSFSSFPYEAISLNGNVLSFPLSSLHSSPLQVRSIPRTQPRSIQQRERSIVSLDPHCWYQLGRRTGHRNNPWAYTEEL